MRAWPDAGQLELYIRVDADRAIGLERMSDGRRNSDDPWHRGEALIEDPSDARIEGRVRLLRHRHWRSSRLGSAVADGGEVRICTDSNAAKAIASRRGAGR